MRSISSGRHCVSTWMVTSSGTRSSSISWRTKSKSGWLADGKPTSISLKPICTRVSNIRSLRAGSIGSMSAWLPSRRSTEHQRGAFSIARVGHVRSVERRGERRERPVLLERHRLGGHVLGRHRVGSFRVAVDRGKRRHPLRLQGAVRRARYGRSPLRKEEGERSGRAAGHVRTRERIKATAFGARQGLRDDGRRAQRVRFRHRRRAGSGRRASGSSVRLGVERRCRGPWSSACSRARSLRPPPSGCGAHPTLTAAPVARRPHPPGRSRQHTADTAEVPGRGEAGSGSTHLPADEHRRWRPPAKKAPAKKAPGQEGRGKKATGQEGRREQDGSRGRS